MSWFLVTPSVFDLAKLMNKSNIYGKTKEELFCREVYCALISLKGIS